MPTASYDLIVIGDDFAGLVAATLCARRGMRVLVLRETKLSHRYRIGSHVLPSAPLPLVGTAGPALKRVLEELALDHPARRRLRVEATSFQIVAPDLRVDVGADDKLLERELGRELPEPEALLAAFTGAAAVARQLGPYLQQDLAIPPTGFWERREIGRNADKIEEEAGAWFAATEADPLVRALVELPSMAGAYGDPRWLTPTGRARLLHVWRQGAPRMRGDWAELRELFAEKLAHHNGEIHSGRAAELVTSWGKVSGVRLENGDDIGCGYVIASRPVADLVELFGSKPPKRLVQAAESVLPAGHQYTLNLVMDEAGIPEGMASTVLSVLDPEQPLVGDNAFAIYVGEPDDEARVVLSLQAVATPRQDDPDPTAGFARLRTQLLARLESVTPFYERHVIAAHSPNEPPEAQDIDERDLELAAPLPAQPIWHSDLEATLGVSAVPYSVGIKNLSIASSQVLPGLGLEGLFTAGWCAAKLACAASGKKRDYLKNEVIAGAR